MSKKTERNRRNARKKKNIRETAIATATGDAKRILGNATRRRQTGRA